MSKFPIINLFPLHDGPSEEDIKMFNFAKAKGFPVRPLRENVTISNHKDFLLHTIKNYSRSGIVFRFREALPKSSSFQKIKQLTPKLKDVPEVNKYRNTPENASLSDVDSEVFEYGFPVESGQVLYHGGSQEISSKLITTRPLSTTYCPEVALWHADNDYRSKGKDNPKPVVWILEIAPCCNKKAVVFRKGGSNMENEYEVLFGSGLEIISKKKYTKNCVFGVLTIIEAVVK
ncbi:DUF4885 domain-containing protein [Vibrio sp. B513a]|uniref:DUF4885 domain-containing protein n=1 Tax=Vibrio TaxID=662 RepID=UPI001EFDBFB6|nr:MULTISPECIES: DUF4885 domain-containing protein [Vibrio]EIP0122539.1 hypothetical protein [Vibrio alginolyticus]EKK7180237.1 hypothetical protein [Vibrio alginolyticus]EMB9226944.1 hypothetical protein [Vibrio alginolyticus]MCG9744748.1 DUF4885 domain-containing protein [Vibrio alginolyticus]MDK9749431.1 DUF4885 domain-containing protein [Vibrio sp. B513a]